MEFLNKVFKNKNIQGFSLIEIVIVVAIIALLILAGIVSMKTQLLKSHNARRKTDINKIKIAAEEYEKDNDCYPSPTLVVCEPGTGLVPYLSKIPCDSVTGGSFKYETDGKACASWYRIFVNMEYAQDPDVIKLNCQYGCGPGFAYNYYQSSPNAPLPPIATSPVPSPSATTNPPGPGQFYGCKSGVCQPVSPVGGDYCEPKFTDNNCYGQCKNLLTQEPTNECIQ
jgi:prepilin-type N-terminal cleavage/methylation domain-containing protein